MAIIHKVELYIVDTNNDCECIDEVTNILERFTDYFYQFANCKSVNFEWSDDLKINSAKATNEDYEEYFKNI